MIDYTVEELEWGRKALGYPDTLTIPQLEGRFSNTHKYPLLRWFMILEEYEELWLDNGVDFHVKKTTSFASHLRETALKYGIEVTIISKEDSIKVTYKESLSKVKYDWANWLDGKWHTISFDDISMDPATFRTYMKTKCLPHRHCTICYTDREITFKGHATPHVLKTSYENRYSE